MFKALQCFIIHLGEAPYVLYCSCTTRFRFCHFREAPRVIIQPLASVFSEWLYAALLKLILKLTCRFLEFHLGRLINNLSQKLFHAFTLTRVVVHYCTDGKVCMNLHLVKNPFHLKGVCTGASKKKIEYHKVNLFQ